jgi:hypothetical protein
MKTIKILSGMMVAAALMLGANRASAFPLYLTSLSGTITSTASYGSSNTTTSNKVVTVSVTLAKMLTVVSNQVFLDTAASPPADAKIVFEPVTLELYLTNSSGYYRSLSTHREGSLRIRDLATTFSTNGLLENDRLVAELDLYGTGPDGLYYEFDVRGAASLNVPVNVFTGVANMSISMGNNGSGYGSYKSSSDGVSVGGFTFKASGVPDWPAAYSVYWWNNLN